jgi:hypothetical protein
MRFLALLALAAFGLRAADVQLITSDIENFWKAYDAAAPGQRTDAFQKLYFDPGTEGLKDFITARIESAETLAKTVDRTPKFFATVRANTLKVDSQKPAILKALAQFQELYPEANFPAVYFLIGRISSGGTTGKSGLLIGTEIFSLGPGVDASEINPSFRKAMGTIDKLPLIVVHELTHTQARRGAAVQEARRKLGTMLVNVIGEGAADFMTELAAGSTINAYQHEYADPRREELFKRFAAERAVNRNDAGNWLYNYDKVKDEPADLGYWLGAEICRDYYTKAADKRAAIREIVTVEHVEAIVRGSQYAWLLN